MSLVKAFARFVYEFVVGDDWKIAASVVVALGITAAVLATAHRAGSDLGPWTLLGAALVLGLFVVVVLVDLRPRKPRD